MAFEKLKKSLSSAPILAHPDFSFPFILDTDASGYGIGAVLSQEIDGQERVIAYASRTLSKSERQYCVTRRELVALVFGVKHFKHYLYGHHCTVRTDHGALTWLMSSKEPQGQTARWIEFLSTFDLTVKYRAGAQHRNADALSRIPCPQCKQCEKIGRDPDVQDANPLGNVRQTKTESFEKDKLDAEQRIDTEISRMQADDSDLQFVKNWLLQHKRPPAQEVKAQSNVVRGLYGQWEQLEMRSGTLCRKFKGTKCSSIQYQILVPYSKRKEILNQCHDAPSAGHLGVFKTLARVRQRFYWVGLQRDVRQYVTACKHCVCRKRRTGRRAPMQTDQVGAPLQKVATDLMGPLPETKSGNRYVLVVSDYFTKWTESFALRNMEAKTVARVIVEEFVSRFGVPESIHSDQGRQYESHLFQEMCELLGIRKTRTTPYHPQSDGMVERFNKTLATMLSAYVSKCQDDWDEYLPYVMMAYRSSTHESTGFSPNMLMMGREVSTPLDLMYELPSEIKPKLTSDWVTDLRGKLENVHELARRHSKEAMMRQKKFHDIKLDWSSFDEGDQVYVFFPRRFIGKSPKLMSFWQGPFTIKEKLSNVTYQIKREGDKKSQVVHVDRIRPCKSQLLVDTAELVNSEDTEESVYAGNELPEQELVDEILIGRQGRERKRPAWHTDFCFDYVV